ncbi:venom allergen 3-like [Drosophila innubila]|uniref:venom allergen 3-like n=1 Tax=Drosophila innubila TaxID=198719 RepID=UPI00148BB68F|nr:venom allergen 3-like [Drosophila innubila]
MPFHGPIFKTKMPHYIMRGELRTPNPPEDYCRKKLCPPDVNHIACDIPFWGPRCTKPRDGVNMEKLKIIIVDHHNNLRDRLSRAPFLKNLPPAKALPKIYWDHELSILAMRVTNFCNDDKVSECVNTARFLNVARSSFKSDDLPAHYTPFTFTLFAIEKVWFSHSENVDEKFVYSFPSNASRKDYELANIINHKVNYVGCGILIQGPGHKRIFYITCLYNEKAKPGEKLYELQELKPKIAIISEK